MVQTEVGGTQGESATAGKNAGEFMFKIGLLTSTAMTAVTLLLSGAADAYAQSNMHIASRDRNTRFLCNYVTLRVYAEFGEMNSSSAFGSAWSHVAVPVTGHGQTVRRIRVVETQSADTSNSSFTVGIYSNTANGLPGAPIAVGTGRANPSCGPVKVSIRPTKLKSHQKYWIEQRTSTRGCRGSIRGRGDANRREVRPSQCLTFTRLYWEANPNAKRTAYVQSHSESWSSGSVISSYTSPWTKQTTGPYFKLR